MIDETFQPATLHFPVDWAALRHVAWLALWRDATLWLCFYCHTVQDAERTGCRNCGAPHPAVITFSPAPAANETFGALR